MLSRIIIKKAISGIANCKSTFPLLTRSYASRFTSRPTVGSTVTVCSRCFLKQVFRQSATTTASEVTVNAEKTVGKWLLACAGMCFGAVAIGGITRLTESGLSMTQWHLIKDMQPPRTQEEWEAEFERYKSFPEYKHLERELDLNGFKTIFYWEYIHRMWGRSVGLVFALPALYFLRKGYISRALKPRLAVYGTLLVGQGLLGWYMVKSGLEIEADSSTVPRVSQYRLAAHLGSAFILYSLFLHQGLSYLITPQHIVNTKQIATLRKLAYASKALIFITAISGAFVAGLDAGLTYNTWPKMADRWVPDDILAMSPKWKNFFENATTVQFDHRILGKVTGATVLGLWFYARRLPLPSRARMVVNALGAMAVVQVSLGVATLLTYVPVPLAASHQSGSLILLSLALWLSRELKRIPK